MLVFAARGAIKALKAHHLVADIIVLPPDFLSSMGNKGSKLKATQNPASGPVAVTASPSIAHAELRSEIESICELYDEFVRNKASQSDARASCLQLDFDALFQYKGQPTHELVRRLIAPSATAVDRPPSPSTTRASTAIVSRSERPDYIPDADHRAAEHGNPAISTQQQFVLPEPLSPSTTILTPRRDVDQTSDIRTAGNEMPNRSANLPNREQQIPRPGTASLQPLAHVPATGTPQYFALQIGVNYSDSDQPIGGVVGNFSSMMRFWAELGVQFSQHVLCSDEVDSAKRLGAHVLKGATLEELFAAMQEVSDTMSRSTAQQKFLYLHVVSLTTDAPKPNAVGGRGQKEQFGQAIVPCDHEDCGFLFVDEIAAWLKSLPRHSCFAVFDALQSDPVSSVSLPVASGTFVSGCHEDVQFATRVSAGAGCQNVTTALLGALNGVDDVTESQLKTALNKAVRSGVPDVSCTSATVLQGWSVPAAAASSVAFSTRDGGAGRSRFHDRVPNDQVPTSGNVRNRILPQIPSSPMLQSSGGRNSPVFIRRDASMRNAANAAPSASARPATATARMASDARSAFMGTSSNAPGRSPSAATSSSARDRKAFLSDDSTPSPGDVPPPARGVVRPAAGRFPTAVQLQSSASAIVNTDMQENGFSNARNAGMSSPIRRRDVLGLGQIARGGPRHSPNGSFVDSQHSSHTATGLHGAEFLPPRTCFDASLILCFALQMPKLRGARGCRTLLPLPGEPWFIVRCFPRLQLLSNL